jgi:hypothetical protein
MYIQRFIQIILGFASAQVSNIPGFVILCFKGESPIITVIH